MKSDHKILIMKVYIHVISSNHTNLNHENFWSYTVPRARTGPVKVIIIAIRQSTMVSWLHTTVVAWAQLKESKMSALLGSIWPESLVYLELEPRHIGYSKWNDSGQSVHACIKFSPKIAITEVCCHDQTDSYPVTNYYSFGVWHYAVTGMTGIWKAYCIAVEFVVTQNQSNVFWKQKIAVHLIPWGKARPTWWISSS